MKYSFFVTEISLILRGDILMPNRFFEMIASQTPIVLVDKDNLNLRQLESLRKKQGHGFSASIICCLAGVSIHVDCVASPVARLASSGDLWL